MKKTIALCILGLFIVSGIGAAAQSVGTTTRSTATVSFSQPTLTSDNTYVSVSLNEANAFLMKQGKPVLPSYTQTFTYPFGTTIKSVMVTPQDIHQEQLLSDLAPTPAIVGLDQPLTVASTDYGTDPYPATWFNYRVGCGLENGARRIIVDVDVYPIQYNPAENTISWAGQANIVVTYDEPSTPPNPSFLDSYKLVVIGPSTYSSQIAPLITHKTGMGVASKFVSITDITGSVYFPVAGRDLQEQIKYFIKNAIENWNIDEVLLVGGNSSIPARVTHVHIADDPDYGHELFSSDLYYADIYDSGSQFCSWDSNGNNVFGEYDWNGQTDTVDLHADVYIARIPASSTTQVTSVVNKIIGYEDTPGYQQSWFPNLALVGGDSFDDSPTNINEGEYANQKVADLLTGFIPTKLWVSNGKLTGYTPTGLQNIINTIEAGCGFMDFNGHGATSIWATHPHTDFGTWVPTPIRIPGGLHANDVQNFDNGNKLPIVTVEACDTARFGPDPNCFNWAFLYNANGGAIGTFGATGIGYSYIGTGVTQGLIGKMGLDTYKAYKTNGAKTFGEMWYRALERYITSGMAAEDYKTVEEWQPFGDPSMVIQEASNPPAKPTTPSGQASGKIGTSYTYTSSATDPDGDKVYLMFDWGDNTTSGWVGPYNSGATGTASHTWSKQGSFSVKVMAKDTHGKFSVWSNPLPIQMPLTNQYAFGHPLLQFLQWLVAQFPNAFQFLHALLG
jgi:hypothetical protein